MARYLPIPAPGHFRSCSCPSPNFCLPAHSRLIAKSCAPTLTGNAKRTTNYCTSITPPNPNFLKSTAAPGVTGPTTSPPSPKNEKLRQDPTNTDHSPGPKTQQLLTTIIGKNLLVLVCTTMVGQEEADTEKNLLNAAKSLVLHPKPLSQEQIKELCLQREQRFRKLSSRLHLVTFMFLDLFCRFGQGGCSDITFP